MDNSKEMEKLSEPFKALIGNQALNYQILDLLPIPIEIFSPDGMCIFGNRALLKLFGMPDPSFVVGKYNFNNDPVCLEIMGQDVYDRILRGETVFFPNFPAPIQDAIDHGIFPGKPFEAATMDVVFMSVFDGDVLTCIIMLYDVKNVYQGRTEIARAKEYMDSHWLDDFNPDAVAAAVNLSPSHLYALFRQSAGMTLNDYHHKVKVDHIKEKLMDKSLSVAEAFSFCGEDSRGWAAKVFKELTGMTPTEYRNSLK